MTIARSEGSAPAGAEGGGSTPRIGAPFVQGQDARWIVLGACGIAVLTNGFSYFMAVRVAEHPPSFESTWFFLPFFGVAMAGYVSFVIHRRQIVASKPAMIATSLLMIAVILPSLWSTLPTLGPQRSAITGGIILFGAVLGTVLPVRQLVEVVFLGMSAPVIASAVAVALWPDIGRMGPDQFGFEPGYYQGIFGNRNSLGPVAMLLLISAVPLLGHLRRRDWPVLLSSYSFLAIGCAVWMVAGAQSTTPVVAGVVGVGIAGSVSIARSTMRGKIPDAVAAAGAFAIAGAVAAFSFISLERLMSIANAEATLTNRRVVWRAARSFISERPLAGYGFWSVWDDPGLVLGDGVTRLPDGYGSAHNSVLEMALAAGIPGAMACGVFFLAACAVTVRYLWREGGLDGAWLVATTFFLVAEHAMESFVLWHSYNLALVTAALFAGSRPGTQASVRRTAGQTDVTTDRPLAPSCSPTGEHERWEDQRRQSKN